jgi:hypothetical protein
MKGPGLCRAARHQPRMLVGSTAIDRHAAALDGVREGALLEVGDLGPGVPVNEGHESPCPSSRAGYLSPSRGASCGCGRGAEGGRGR